MRRYQADLILLACAAIWGFAFLFQKSAMAHVGPLVFVATRSIVACIALTPMVLFEHRTAAAMPRAILRSALAAGLSFFVAAILQQAGIISATVTNTGFLTALYVVVTPFIAWALLGQRPAPLVWVAAGVSFVGTWLLGGGGLGRFSLGDLLVACSAAFWALHVVLVGRAAMLGFAMTFTALQFAVVSVLSAVAATALEPISFTAIQDAAVSIIYVGVLSSALTFSLFALALRATRPAEAAIIVSTETVFAAIGAYLIVGERLPVIGWMGAGAILASIALVQLSQAWLPKNAAKPQATTSESTGERP
jgi:drug/metabolite transporter (DMT)-like permease